MCTEQMLGDSEGEEDSGTVCLLDCFKISKLCEILWNFTSDLTMQKI